MTFDPGQQGGGGLGQEGMWLTFDPGQGKVVLARGWLTFNSGQMGGGPGQRGGGVGGPGQGG